jgi:hypothetical protein
MLISRRPSEIGSIVTAMRAANAGGMGQDSDRGEQLDTGGHRCQPRHQGERFEIVVPVLRGSPEPVQLDHRQRKINAEALGLLDDLPVQIEARHILGSGGRYQPAISCRNEYAELHGLHPSGSMRLDYAALTVPCSLYDWRARGMPIDT